MTDTRNDEHLQQQAKALFDSSVEQLDAATLSRLNQGRHKALAELHRPGLVAWGRWAPAAGVAAAAVVGEAMCRIPGIAGKVFSVLGDSGVNVRAIAQGSSELNISLVIDRRDEARSLAAVHRARAEIAANPNVELCYLDDKHDQVRITGCGEQQPRLRIRRHDLDLPQLHAEAANLDLVVDAPQESDDALGQPLGEVSGAVEPLPGTAGERVRHQLRQNFGR